MGPETLVEIAGHLYIEVAFQQQGNCSETHPECLDKARSRIKMQELVKVNQSVFMKYFEI